MLDPVSSIHLEVCDGDSAWHYVTLKSKFRLLIHQTSGGITPAPAAAQPCLLMQAELQKP